MGGPPDDEHGRNTPYCEVCELSGEIVDACKDEDGNWLEAATGYPDDPYFFVCEDHYKSRPIQD